MAKCEEDFKLFKSFCFGLYKTNATKGEGGKIKLNETQSFLPSSCLISPWNKNLTQAGGNLPDWMFLLLLLSVGVQGQADDTSEGGGGSGDGGDSAGGDDEAWLYVEFLKTEVK